MELRRKYEKPAEAEACRGFSLDGMWLYGEGLTASRMPPSQCQRRITRSLSQAPVKGSMVTITIRPRAS